MTQRRAALPAPLALLGVDFTCAPTRRKPITVARGALVNGVLRLAAVDTLPSLPAFEALLAEPGPWFGAFDFPFGLPRAFVDAQGLGADTDTVIAELQRRCGSRMGFRALVDAWGNGRPPGQRLLHRATDCAGGAGQSTSPLQTRYVPVGFMYYEGLSRLVAAGVTIPRLRRGDPARIAVEGYPGRLALHLLGSRTSYKNRDAADRRQARGRIVDGLVASTWPLHLSAAQRCELLDDASGDRLDAVLCLAQAAAASRAADQGLPAKADAVEGWITDAVVTTRAPLAS